MGDDRLGEWGDYGGYDQPSLFSQDARPVGQEEAVPPGDESTTANQPTKEDAVEQQQQGVGIGPVPTDINIGQLDTGPGQPNMVLLVFGTPIGSSHYFLPAEVAEQVGNHIVSAAKQARSGLVLPQIKLVK